MGTSRYPMEHTGAEAIRGKLIYISHSKYEHDWDSLLHTHPFAELFYVRSGRGSLLIDAEEYPLCQDDFVIVNPNVSHTEKSSDDMPLECVIIGVEGLAFSFEGNREHVTFSCRNEQKNLLFYMDTMLEELTEKSEDYETVCKSLLEILIINLIRRANFAFELVPSIQISKECVKIKRYIESNYMHDLTLESLARLSHLNKYYMAHAFTMYCGCSPISYLCQTRIRASKELLANTDFSITQIAQLSGFSSQSYFAQCFRKSLGMSASAYRKSCKKT